MSERVVCVAELNEHADGADWFAADRPTVWRSQGHRDVVMSMVGLTGRGGLASGGLDKSLRVWDLNAGVWARLPTCE